MTKDREKTVLNIENKNQWCMQGHSMDIKARNHEIGGFKDGHQDRRVSSNVQTTEQSKHFCYSIIRTNDWIKEINKLLNRLWERGSPWLFLQVLHNNGITKMWHNGEK